MITDTQFYTVLLMCIINAMWCYNLSKRLKNKVDRE